MAKKKNEITLIEWVKALVLNKVKPVFVGFETANLSGGDIPIFKCPSCGREFTTGHHCKCGAKFDWSI